MGVQYNQLTEGERNQIYALRKGGNSLREIAKMMDRTASTISREIKRNSGKKNYRPKQAQDLCNERRRKPRTQKMKGRVIEYIEEKLQKDWSPEQISETMEKAIGESVCYETIYRYIWQDKKQDGKLYTHLRIGGTKQRRKKRGSKDWRGRIPNRVDIDERPKIVEEKGRIGDWEADLVSGAHHKGFLVTLVERKMKYTLIGHVLHKTSESVEREIIRLLKEHKNRVHTITFDNGREFMGHMNIAKELDCKCYFAKPYHSWERGLNENTNGLIRQYVPKQLDLRNISQVELQWIMDRLNFRPRKTLDFKTPHELFWSHCSEKKNVALRS